MATIPTLTVIILSYNTKELTKRAVMSCLKLSYPHLQVVVVDNHSHDGSNEAMAELAKRYSNFHSITLSKNKGFSGGNNVALKKVNSEYVMLLNSDAYFEHDSDVGVLMQYLENNPTVGMLTPKVLLGHRTLDPASHRGFPTPWNAFCYYSGLEKLVKRFFSLQFQGVHKLFGGYHMTWFRHDSVHEIDACTGAAVIVRTTAMNEVGVLDERFFMYGEDLDWCYRMKEKGWKVVFHPGVTIIHDKHISGLKKMKMTNDEKSKEIQQHTHDAFFHAMKLFYQKHYHERYPAIVYTLVQGGISLISKLR